MNCCDDVIMCKLINYEKPWQATHGTITETWDELAKKLMQTPGFGCHKTGKKIRSRFLELMLWFGKEDKASLRKSGTEEQYEERDQLLQGIKQQMDDWNQNAKLVKKTTEAKVKGMLLSGDFALGKISGNFEDNQDSEEDVHTMESDSDSATMTPQKSLKRKKSQLGDAKGSGRKMTKLERTQGIFNAVENGVLSLQSNENALLAISRERFEFDKEQARLGHQRFLFEQEQARLIHERFSNESPG